MGLEAKQFGLQGLPLVRSKYEPELPPSLKGGNVKVVKGDGTTASDPSDALAITRAYPHTYAQPLVQLVAADAGQVKKHSPLRIGVVFCGRQSPGGHNIITGLFDALKKHNSESTLIGFIGE
jgi:pyrophosphate--fructose-6-phosphate 1-phosphotransferase